MNGLVEERVGLVVHRVHGVVRDVMERDERGAAQLLRAVALRVRVQAGHLLVLYHAGQLGIEVVERRGATMVCAEDYVRAHRAAELPELGLLLPERLPEWHMRAFAQILEARAPVVRAFAQASVGPTVHY